MRIESKRSNIGFWQFILLCLAALLSINFYGQTASGGAYLLDRSVVTDGSGKAVDAVNGVYAIEHSIGQPVTDTSAGGIYNVRSGFWQQSLLPTAAGVTISGRVTNGEGRGVTNTIVTLTNSHGTTWRVMTTRGYYQFAGVESGQTYVMTVIARRFQFTPRIVDAFDNLTDIDFVASP